MYFFLFHIVCGSFESIYIYYNNLEILNRKEYLYHYSR